MNGAGVNGAGAEGAGAEQPTRGACGGERPGTRPGPRGRTVFLPGLLLGVGAATDLFDGAPLPWLGGAGLLAAGALYAAVVTRLGAHPGRGGRGTLVLLAAQAALTAVLALAYGGAWTLLFMMTALACGTVLPIPGLVLALVVLSGSAGVISGHRGGELWMTVISGYGTFVSGILVASLLGLAATVDELRRTREELALAAVDRERLRFSRDLHDLLGHSMSVVVVKAEAVRRLAPHSAEAAVAQAADIEEVGRRALAEIREAVSGYRGSGLSAELDRARSALEGAGVAVSVRRSGPPPGAEAEALLGWVVREAVTNVIRHSGAAHADITVEHDGRAVRVAVADDGTGRREPRDADPAAPEPGAPGLGTGTGLTGLAERLALSGGVLEAGDGPLRGFRVAAEMPVRPR